MKTLVVNMCGAPGSGKSTMAARLFARLKENGYLTELATEYAKDMVWQESNHVLNNQVYIFGKQHNRIWRLYGKVQIIITDAPLINSIVYGETSEEFKTFVLSEIKKFDHINIFLDRAFKYETEGRYQSEEQAKELSDKIMRCLSLDDEWFKYYMNDGTAFDNIYNLIIESLNN